MSFLGEYNKVTVLCFHPQKQVADEVVTPETDVEAGEVFHDAEDHSKDVETNVNAPQEDGDEIPREDESKEEANHSESQNDSFGPYQLPNSPDQAREILG